ncbi:MAG TPA: sulfotransferase [Pyrinomonadaceae bacterium]
MPICIAGMHRSGTSMVTRLLQACGLFLGREEELGFDSNNGELHFEHLQFVALNDEILGRLGGSWNSPPDFPTGWETMPEIEALTGKARKLTKRLSKQYYWGWKDPRNSLTLRFWQRIVPDLRVVICLRNPLEVRHSLHKRGDLIGIPLFLLWLTYYRELLSAILPQQRLVVTHYESYFQDPASELRRVANQIGMDVPAEVITRACTQISADLRHHQISELSGIDVPNEVRIMYTTLCHNAGPIFSKV